MRTKLTPSFVCSFAADDEEEESFFWIPNIKGETLQCKLDK